MLTDSLAGAFRLRDFSNGISHVIKTTIAESYPGVELFTQQTFVSVPTF